MKKTLYDLKIITHTLILVLLMSANSQAFIGSQIQVAIHAYGGVCEFNCGIRSLCPDDTLSALRTFYSNDFLGKIATATLGLLGVDALVRTASYVPIIGNNAYIKKILLVLPIVQAGAGIWFINGNNVLPFGIPSHIDGSNKIVNLTLLLDGALRIGKNWVSLRQQNQKRESNKQPSS